MYFLGLRIVYGHLYSFNPKIYRWYVLSFNSKVFSWWYRPLELFWRNQKDWKKKNLLNKSRLQTCIHIVKEPATGLNKNRNFVLTSLEMSSLITEILRNLYQSRSRPEWFCPSTSYGPSLFFSLEGFFEVTFGSLWL